MRCWMSAVQKGKACACELNRRRAQGTYASSRPVRCFPALPSQRRALPRAHHSSRGSWPGTDARAPALPSSAAEGQTRAVHASDRGLPAQPHERTHPHLLARAHLPAWPRGTNREDRSAGSAPSQERKEASAFKHEHAWPTEHTKHTHIGRAHFPQQLFRWRAHRPRDLPVKINICMASIVVEQPSVR